MGLENRNTQGSKGSNSQYQRGVIELLTQLVSVSGGGSGGGALNTALKGTTPVGNPTSHSKSANVTALDVQIVDASGNQITNFGGAVTNDGTFATPANQATEISHLANMDGELSAIAGNTNNTAANTSTSNANEGLMLNELFNIDTATTAINARKGQQSAANSNSVALANEDLQDLYIIGAATQTALVNNILPSASGANATDIQMYRSFAIQVISTATGGAFIFECSNDNVNFQPFPIFNNALLIPIPIVTTITPTVSQFLYVGGCMFRYIRLRISTTITGGSIQAFSSFTQHPFSISQTVVAQGTAANLNANINTLTSILAVTPGTGSTNLGKARNTATGATDTGVGFLALREDIFAAFGTTGSYTTPIADKYGSLIIKDQQRHKRTYSTAFLVVPGTTPTDIVQIIGSATTTVSITKIRISGLLAVAGQILTIFQKRSSANTGGTSSTATLVPYDSGDAAATTVISIYTVNPSALGTSIGNIREEYIPMGPVTGGNQVAEFKFADGGKSLVLNGIAQTLCINLNSVVTPPTSIAIEIEFTEE